jgi:hypothetical protein
MRNEGWTSTNEYIPYEIKHIILNGVSHFREEGKKSWMALLPSAFANDVI